MINLNDGASGTAIAQRRLLDLGITVLAFNTSTAPTSGSFIKGSSLASPGNIAVLFDNVAGNGRPLAMTVIESIGTTIASTISGYGVSSGDWNTIIPNSNANGVKRIDQYSISSGSSLFYNQSSNGTWGTTVTANPASGNTPLIISSSDAPLPVNFIGFSVTQLGKNNLLSWSTASEQNNAGFEVQRSTDGTTYENIGFVKSLSATGNSSSPLSYSFTDFNPLGLQQYYRLKQTDLDGKSAYSAIVLVKREAPATLTVTKVYPNPSTSSIYINAACPAATTLQLSIVDMNGRVVGRKQVNAMTGNNGFDMPVTQLAPGTYLLQVLNADNKVVTTEKFIKQ
jgi:hypothetical protein